MWWIATLPLIVVIFGTVGYRMLEGWSWLSSLYMTMITVTTVGYGETHPMSDGGRLFTIILIFLSLITVAYCTASVSRFVMEGDLKHFLHKVKMEKVISKLKDHYIVCGYGRKGQAICESLTENGIPLVIIEHTSEKQDVLEASPFSFIIGNAVEDQTLSKARIEYAKGLIAILGDNAENVLLVISARQMNTELQILAWAAGKEMERKLYRAGANQVFSPYTLGGVQIVNNILRPDVMKFIDFALRFDNEQLQLEQITIPSHSEFIGQTIHKQKVQEIHQVMILALQRNQKKIFNPPPETLFKENDILISLGSKEHLQSLKQQIDHKSV